jgi:hypothetical protein
VSVPDKPLYVRVAEVLGWTGIYYAGNFMVPDSDLYMGKKPGGCLLGERAFSGVPRYDLLWSATGPLIEKYNINLHANYAGRGALPGPWWEAVVYFQHSKPATSYKNETPLLAVCNLIVANPQHFSLDSRA